MRDSATMRKDIFAQQIEGALSAPPPVQPPFLEQRACHGCGSIASAGACRIQHQCLTARTHPFPSFVPCSHRHEVIDWFRSACRGAEHCSERGAPRVPAAVRRDRETARGEERAQDGGGSASASDGGGGCAPSG
jgi:hypothetical protein